MNLKLWKVGEYLMLQIKSAGIRFRLTALYFHGEELYDKSIYCVGLGTRGYHCRFRTLSETELSPLPVQGRRVRTIANKAARN